MSSWLPTWVATASSTGRQHDGVHPPGPRGLGRRHVHQHVAAADLEERVVVHPARRAGRVARPPRPARPSPRRTSPGPRPAPRRPRPRRPRSPGPRAARRARARARARAAGAATPRQRASGPAPTRGGAGARRRGAARVSGSEERHDASDLGQRDVELAEPVDDLGGRDLVDAVVAVAGGGVDGGRHQQVRVVVAAQRAHAQVGQSRELADRQHARSVHPPPAGESSA